MNNNAVITTKLRLNFVVSPKVGMDQISVTAVNLDDNLPHPPFDTGECTFFIYAPQGEGAKWAKENFKVDSVEVKNV